MNSLDELLNALELSTQAAFALSDHIGELRESIDRLTLQDRSSSGAAVDVACVE